MYGEIRHLKGVGGRLLVAVIEFLSLPVNHFQNKSWLIIPFKQRNNEAASGFRGESFDEYELARHDNDEYELARHNMQVIVLFSKAKALCFKVQ